MCEQPLSRGISCLPSPHARVKENSAVQGNANAVTYVQGWVLYCGRVVRELGSFRKAKKINKVFRVTE